MFAFDLDGTVTSREMLPVIAKLAGLEEAVEELTRLTLSGRISFERSFHTRFAMLKGLPLALVHKAVENIPLNPHIEAFIQQRRDQCALITGNLDLWIAPLVSRLGCRCFASRGMFSSKGLKLLSIVDKGKAVARLNREGYRVIAVGESVNDIPMLSAAAQGIAFAGVHKPVPAIRRMAHYQTADGASLCALLEKLGGPVADAQSQLASEPAPHQDAPARPYDSGAGKEVPL